MTLDEAKGQLNITVDLLPAASSNRPGTRLDPEYVTIHNTGNSSRGADARAHARYMKGEDAQRRQVSWHFTVDDGAVFQSLPEREVGWHAGRGNARSIGLEICENEGIDQAEANRRAALLTAVLLKQHGIEPEGHVVQHHYWTGKDCPRVLRREGWDNFLEMVRRFHRQLGESAREECTLCVDGEGGAAEMAGMFGGAAEREDDEGGGRRAFSTEPARSGNDDGSSETTGLRGTIVQGGGGVEIVDAVEGIHAVREGRDLGRKDVRQVRTRRNGEIFVEQADYCWQARALPAATLVENFDGFGAEDGIIRGRATYFGKYDREDEGTGTPLFRTVQTNSSVFAMSLPRATLLRYGFARDVGGVLRSTERGLSAIIDVYCPSTRRLARLPLADIGPGAGTGAVADLSAAAVAWLLGREEREANHYGLPNPQVHVRIS